MTGYQVDEQSIKPLSVAESGPRMQANNAELNGHLPQTEPSTNARPPREFGCARHLLASVDIDALMAVSIDDMFADYMPEDN